ncbi:uncharacterized protein CTRU02_215821 [Colletotrichum truncatum]|uniref:Uncharacterized protein n=1 Tax=Colletotrichum truncatum TaxID=5467 RepID=A0ACC3YAW7_COLTU|nr:uncharacterized protein CTRU02_15195 [Colletotrichum truncatum]KAF6781305.1 hypothetical protein CTRU02_15195 [Colletotrichum truncatum]
MEGKDVDALTRKVFTHWHISDLADIMGPDRSPPLFSEHLRRNLAALSQETSLEQAREWLTTEIDARQNDGYQNRGPQRNFLTAGDVKGVLETRVPDRKTSTRARSSSLQVQSPISPTRAIQPVSSLSPVPTSAAHKLPGNASILQTMRQATPQQQEQSPNATQIDQTRQQEVAKGQSKIHERQGCIQSTPRPRPIFSLPSVVNSPTKSQVRPASVLAKYKRKRADILAELADDIHELDLRVKVAQSNVKFAQHKENKASNELQSARIAEQEAPSESQIETRIQDKVLLQAALDEFRTKNQSLLEARHAENLSGNREDTCLPEENRPRSVAFYIGKAATQIVEDVKRLQDDRLTIRKIKEAASAAVRAAEEDLAKKRDEVRTLVNLASDLENDYNAAIDEKALLES